MQLPCLFMNYNKSLNALKSPEVSPVVAVVNKVDVNVAVSPINSIAHEVSRRATMKECDDHDVFLFKKLREEKDYPYVCKYNLKSPAVRFCRNKEAKVKLSSRILKDSIGYYLEIIIEKGSQELKKGTLLGVIKQSNMEVLEVPVNWKSPSNSINNVHNVIPAGLTFTELLTVFADVEYIRNESRVVCQGHGKPIVITITKYKEVHGLEMDPATIQLFDLKTHAIKLKKKNNVECIKLQVSGPVGMVIPKGTPLAKLCYKPLVLEAPGEVVSKVLLSQQPIESDNGIGRVLIPKNITERVVVNGPSKHNVGRINIIQHENKSHMPLIKKSYTLDCTLENVKYVALLDTGSCTTCMSSKAFSKLNERAKMKIMPTRTSFAAAQGTPLEAIGEISLRMESGTWSGNVKFVIMKNLAEDVILGQNYLQTFGRSISLIEHKVDMRCGGIIKLKTEGLPVHVQRVDARLEKNCVIPAGHVRLVKVLCPLNLRVGELVYVEPHTANLSALGVMVAHLAAEASNENSIIISVVNPHDTDVRLRAGMIVGQVHTVKEESAGVLTTTAGHYISLVNDTNQGGPPMKCPPFSEQSHLDEIKKEAICKLLDKYPTLRGEKGIGTTSLTRHRIETGSAAPVKAPSWRRPEVEHQQMEQEVKVMLEAGVIEKSASPWNAPVLLVKKSDGTWRFCVDYRKLNTLTKKDCYPIPRIDETIDKLGKAKIFTTLDLKSGYWQVGMADCDKEKTAFTTRSGHWQFTVMPFGLCNAPATFQRLMDLVLDEYKFEFVLVYLDDIIIYSDTFEEHLLHLDNVFKKIHEAGLTLKFDKCIFATNELKFLGHTITEKGVAVLPEKVEAVRNSKKPSNVTDVRSFLGLANYYRRFVPNFSTVASPLHQLAASKEWCWTNECQQSFEKIKSLLTSAPLLTRPDFEKPFVVYTDASDVGIGGLLTQVCDGLEHVIGYASRTLSCAEKNYGVTERECLAIVYSLKEFRSYIYGTHFKVVTDHMSLTWLAKLHETNPRLTRWILALSEYDFTIAYRPGKSHANADALSRLPPPNVQGEVREEYVPLTYQDVSPKGVQGTPIGVKNVNTMKQCTPMINSCSDNVNVVRTRRGTLKDEINNGEVPTFDSSSAATGRPVRTKRPPELYGERVMTDFYQSYLKSADYDRLLKPPVRLYPESQGDSSNNIATQTNKENLKFKADSSFPMDQQSSYTLEKRENINLHHKSDMDHPLTIRLKKRKISNNQSEEQLVKTLNEDILSPTPEHASNVPVETTRGDVAKTPDTVTANSQNQNREPVEENMSPIFDEQVAQTLSLEEVRKEQDLDPYWKGVKKFLSDGTMPDDVSYKVMISNSASDYELINDVLYYWPKKFRKNGSLIEKRLVIPKRLRPELIQLHHSSLFAGHLGAEKTYLRLQRKYYWVNMYKETHEYCTSCDVCQRAKLTKRQLPIIQHRTYCGMPFSDCYTDFIGPLPTSNGKNHIIVFICPFTKWVEAKAVEDADAETAAMAFVELIVARHGVPHRVISDQGSHFTAQLFKQTMMILQTRNVFTTPYHAQSNGQCERMNGTLVQLLRIYCANNKEKWAEYLPYALFAYRCTVHESTGHTPFEMIYGRNPALPGEEKLLAIEEQGIDEFIKNLRHAIQQVHEMARSKLKKKQMTHYEKQTPKNIKKFSVGEKVLVKSNDPRRHKLEYVYDGPFTILDEVHDGVAYKIDQPKVTLGKTSCTVSVSHLKKYREDP